MYGIEGLQAHVRGGYERAKYFETLVKKHSDYELLFAVTLGLVSFRLHPEGVDEEEVCVHLLRDSISIIASIEN